MAMNPIQFQLGGDAPDGLASQAQALAALGGTYHSFDHAKYGARYLAEFAHRFNRRVDLPAMLARLLRAAVQTRPHPLRALRLSEAGSQSGQICFLRTIGMRNQL